ncbi:MAG: hypothetical protein MJ064_09775 [Lachnospiraceae bacterium]|nr:hypothetical protein [Lachnospiraceae bacterium]
MRSYGYQKSYTEVEILSPKTCGVVGSLLLIISLFLKFWGVEADNYHVSVEFRMVENIYNVIGVVLTIVFYLLALWSESKIFIFLLIWVMCHDFYQLFVSYNELMTEVSKFNSTYGPSVSLNIGLGLIAFIIGTVALLIGLVLKYRE